MNDSREIIRHFTYDELKCKCGNDMCEGLPPLRLHNMEFLKKISVLRDIVGIPLVPTSFYRCPLHGKYRKESAHSMAMGIDLQPRGISVEELYCMAEGHFFQGLGLCNEGNKRNHFVHIDCKEGRIARWKYTEGKAKYLFIWRRT